MSSCDEEGKELLDKLKIFRFQYTYLPDSTFAHSAMILANQPSEAILSQSDTFNYAEVTSGVTNTAQLSGDPNTTASQLLIRMQRNSTNDNTYIWHITIAINGPIEEGQIYTKTNNPNGYFEVYTGQSLSQPYTSFTTKNIDNTDFYLKITSLGLTTKKISGDFYGFARFKDNPVNTNPLLIHNGTFAVGYKSW